jgi:hypothetical protein
MTFNVVYEKENESKNCSYVGFSFAKQYVVEHFPSEIRKKLIDYQGTIDLVRNFETVANTEFDKTILQATFSLEPTRIERWRIGEAFGEFFLEQHFKIRFWYNHLRDLRNPCSSDAGADLVGFVDAGGETLFAFGEVKTSEDENSPPQVVYGRTGLKNQIAELCTNQTAINYLVRYLGFKVRGLQKDDPFYVDFHKALTVYVKSRKRMHLLGLLVRDTACNHNDLSARYTEHEHTTPKDLVIRFIGLYIPIEMEKWELIVNGGVVSD